MTTLSSPPGQKKIEKTTADRLAAAEKKMRRRSSGSAGVLVGRAFGRLVLVVFGVLTLLFILLQSSGDPSAVIAGDDSTIEEIERIRSAYGFDRPMLVQYLDYVWSALRLDFGISFQLNSPAMELVLERLPATLGLIVLAYVVGIGIGMPLGLVSGLTDNKAFEWLCNVIVLAGQAIPVFVYGVLLVWLFSAQLQWFPALASGGFEAPPAALIMPIMTLATGPMAWTLELTRSGIRESMQEDFIRTAESKGVPPWRVVTRHAVRPVLTSLVTILGVDQAGLLSGGVLVEVIFAWPGMGPLLVGAVNNRDYNLVMAATLTFAVIVVLINFAMDLIYRRLDPRTRRNGG